MKPAEQPAADDVADWTMPPEVAAIVEEVEARRSPVRSAREGFLPVPPRDLAREQLLAAVASGADEHLWSAEYLRAAVRASLDLRKTMTVPQLASDVFVAEVARGLVEGLERLDVETEARLADVPGGAG